jgi:hypothetical protein
MVVSILVITNHGEHDVHEIAHLPGRPGEGYNLIQDGDGLGMISLGADGKGSARPRPGYPPAAA